MKKYANFTEEELKTHIWQDYFPKFDLGTFSRLDFALKQKNTDLPFYLLWAEAKKETADIFNSFTQLVLTIGVNTDLQNIPKPPFLAVFDSEKIAFIEYSFLNHFCDSSLFNEISWQNITPSNYLAEEFIKTKSRIQAIIEENAKIFYFEKNEKELKHFISNSLSKGELNPVVVTDKNFDYVYSNWYLEVFKRDIFYFEQFNELRNNMLILESDFFLADLMSKDDQTLDEKLRVILRKKEDGEKNYYFKFNLKDDKFLKDQEVSMQIKIIKTEIHTNFWKMYQRPPLEKFWKEIFNRRDKLAPKDIRERKGAFFTPAIWVKKAQEYLESALGENWQENYYIWDCAAGTGNLLVGLKKPERIFASTIDLNDVVMMKQIVKIEKNTTGEKLDLLENHIFQFDFLNDDFEKLPKKLQDIIQNEPEKLVIFINPPYAEATSHGKKAKSNVALGNKVHEKYKKALGKASNEVFAQFFIRIYKEIPKSKLASFSTLKYVNAENFIVLRETFKSKFIKGFICPANTFDNVNGSFPIGFLVWDLNYDKKIENVILDVFDFEGKAFGFKKFFATENKVEKINDWYRKFNKKIGSEITILDIHGNDFQQQKYISFLPKNNFNHTAIVTEYNLIPSCIYFSVRLIIPATWLNDRDQFLYPNKKWENDKEFQNNCFAYALFHGQNKISSKEGVNHFIPFTEKELKVNEAFESHFLLNFMAGKTPDFLKDNSNPFIPTKPMEFSIEAQNVLNSAKELYIYYHQIAGDEKKAWKINDKVKYSLNAAFYDIKEFFQGRNEKGRMNSKSEDLKYTELLNNLKNAQKILAQKIEPKIYEYGFLLE